MGQGCAVSQPPISMNEINRIHVSIEYINRINVINRIHTFVVWKHEVDHRNCHNSSASHIIQSIPNQSHVEINLYSAHEPGST